MRVADALADGEILNSYTGTVSVYEPAPTTPWAIYLANDHGDFRYLCFDFDASRGNSQYDAARLAYWLDELGIEHVRAHSGPTGGEHLWIAPIDAVDAARTFEIASLAAQLLPSLDVTPLSNPATGCVRPPGSPHRAGGRSRPHSPIDALLEPTVTDAHLHDLRAFLVDAGAELPMPHTATGRSIRFDDTGAPYLAGSRRELSPRIRALAASAPHEDASYTLASVLAGCANARWTLEQVREALWDSPAFEHVRTRRRRGQQRMPRTPDRQERTLRSAWLSAVTYVASNPAGTADHGLDDTFPDRCDAVLRAIDAVQHRANLMPGVWNGAGRPRSGSHAPRAVLDAISLYMLQAVRTEVDADVRRLSADTGYGRTTVHRALRLLLDPADPDDPESAWLVRVGEREGMNAQSYRLSTRFSTTAEVQNRTQVLARLDGPLQRLGLIRSIANHLRPLASDVFAAPRSLGRAAGIIYRAALSGLETISSLARHTGYSASWSRRLLRRLHSHGALPHPSEAPGKPAAEPADLERLADELEVSGHIQARNERHALERRCWSWWHAELSWIRRRGRKHRRSPATAVPLLVDGAPPRHPKYPRGPKGTPDHHLARLLISAWPSEPTGSPKTGTYIGTSQQM